MKQPMFLTWQLWNALRFPMRRHPIFNYARKLDVSSDKPSLRWRFLQVLAFVSVILFAIMLPVPAIITALGLVVGLPLLLIIFNGTVLGTVLVMGIASTIASARKDNRFELMSISLEGGLGVSWLLATGMIHRRNWHKTIYRLLKWVVTLILILLGLAMFMLLIGTFASESELLRQQQANVLRDVINISLIVAVLWLDHIQSLVIALVLGIVIPTIIRTELQLRTMVTVIYLIIQFCTYLAIFILYRLIDIIFTGIWANSFMVSIGITVLSILAFYLMREAIISALWRLMLKQYDASIDEYQRLMNL